MCKQHSGHVPSPFALQKTRQIYNSRFQIQLTRVQDFLEHGNICGLQYKSSACRETEYYYLCDGTFLLKRQTARCSRSQLKINVYHSFFQLLNARTILLTPQFGQCLKPENMAPIFGQPILYLKLQVDSTWVSRTIAQQIHFARRLRRHGKQNNQQRRRQRISQSIQPSVLMHYRLLIISTRVRIQYNCSIEYLWPTRTTGLKVRTKAFAFYRAQEYYVLHKCRGFEPQRFTHRKFDLGHLYKLLKLYDNTQEYIIIIKRTVSDVEKYSINICSPCSIPNSNRAHSNLLVICRLNHLLPRHLVSIPNVLHK
ncbi:Hypothetical_protein [Hexamita inflata]|uniref:Hypothetical_protein n=1 Tax=Hexamita inflata TaxID=28002 RepID=A0AA86Q9B2_9EUKA|nr:Hypothetical protein HINF_LOCUS42544 [Hexamita inflata]